jgi:putative oxygen-independent coproporphyrinogen III oxidase
MTGPSTILPRHPADAFGVYVHWPFCLAKCPYCDFNSHVRAAVDESRFVAALAREAARLAARTGRRAVTSIFFGGGTPSLMSGAGVAEVLGAIDAEWGIASGAEITLEANPTSVEAARFADYRAAGVNRVSLGVQALDDAALKALGREHSAAEARGALATARARFERVSFDLIYAREGQTALDWRRELGEALTLADGHLSLYQLTIEPGTRFFALHRSGALKTPDAELAGELYDLTNDMCGAAGFAPYEVSNYAKPGEESRHNLVYWGGDDYAGIGPGAHSRLTIGGERRAIAARRDPESWLRDAEAGRGDESEEKLEPGDAGAEYLLMALRLSEGASLGRYEARAGRGLDHARIAQAEEDGLVAREGDRLAATRRGRLVLDRLLVELLR